MATSRRELELKAAAVLELRRRKAERNTVIGLVCPRRGLTHAIVQENGEWATSQADPDVFIPAKAEPAFVSDKRFIVLLGGRGSSKSVTIADMCLVDTKDNGAKNYCLREHQTSIKNSVYSLLKDEIKRLQLDNFEVLNTSISHKEEDAFEFAGLARNVDNIKSSHGFKRFYVEEAQFISQDSLDQLTPTARRKPKRGLPGQADEYDLEDVSIVFVANPGSSEDPFSKRFIVPFQHDIDKHGFYEDDLHLIIKMNYTDNPWFEESGLEPERQWDYENRSRAAYDHIWLGAYNDDVEDAIILPEWFDACIDAHIKLGFKAQGAKIASHDPSDTGPDNKGYVARHGSVVVDVQEKETGNVNEGGHWAADLAIQQGIEYFSWDGDGMGAALNEQISNDFKGKATRLVMFKGSEGPDNPEATYKPAFKAPIAEQKTIGETFKNKRCQYAFELRDRIYNTFRAVVFNEYHDPDTLISFSSEIELLPKLRSETCRIPLKPNGNGYLTLYTKDEMKTKFKIASPNLFDPLMMGMRYQHLNVVKPYIPKPVPTYRGR